MVMLLYMQKGDAKLRKKLVRWLTNDRLAGGVKAGVPAVGGSELLHGLCGGVVLQGLRH